MRIRLEFQRIELTYKKKVKKKGENAYVALTEVLHAYTKGMRIHRCNGNVLNHK